MDLTEYKNTLRLDPTSQNTGTWYSRGNVHHNGRLYIKGQQLPDDLTNEQVAQLLDVNTLTSVAPKEVDAEPLPPVHNGAPNQQGTSEDGVAHGNLQTAAGLPNSNDLPEGGSENLPPSGDTRIDENGNEIDEQGNLVNQ